MTRRFKIYRYAMVNLISPDDFDHHEDKHRSTYLLINIRDLDGEKIKEEAVKMFEDSIFGENINNVCLWSRAFV